jgi:hypothetical protein
VLPNLPERSHLSIGCQVHKSASGALLSGTFSRGEFAKGGGAHVVLFLTELIVLFAHPVAWLELLYFKEDLTDAQVAVVNNYYSTKYGLTTPP